MSVPNAPFFCFLRGRTAYLTQSNPKKGKSKTRLSLLSSQPQLGRLVKSPSLRWKPLVPWRLKDPLPTGVMGAFLSTRPPFT